MKEEIKKILKMVEEKKITAEEAERLMEAVEPESTDLVSSGAGTSNSSQKFLRVKVVEGGVNKVNVNIPVSLIEVGLKLGTQIGAQFDPKAEALKDIDFNEVIEAIKNGAQGKLVEVEDGDTFVTVTVE